jgi:hypothetical protein
MDRHGVPDRRRHTGRRHVWRTVPRRRPGPVGGRGAERRDPACRARHLRDLATVAKSDHAPPGDAAWPAGRDGWRARSSGTPGGHWSGPCSRKWTFTIPYSQPMLMVGCRRQDTRNGRCSGEEVAGMNMNDYALEVLARDRLAELRAEAERSVRIRAVRPVPGPLRVALGQALIRMGRRLQGVRRRSRVTASRPGRTAPSLPQGGAR